MGSLQGGCLASVTQKIQKGRSMNAAGWRWGWVKGDKEKMFSLTHIPDGRQLSDTESIDWRTEFVEGGQAQTEMGCSALSQEDRLLRWLCFGGREKPDWAQQGTECEQAWTSPKRILGWRTRYQSHWSLDPPCSRGCSPALFPPPPTPLYPHHSPLVHLSSSFLSPILQVFPSIDLLHVNPVLVSASQRVFVNSSKKDNLQGLKDTANIISPFAEVFTLSDTQKNWNGKLPLFKNVI